MWGDGFDSGDEETRLTALSAGPLEQLIKRHVIRAALIGIACSGGFFLLAYVTPLPRLIVVAVLLLTISLLLLTYGLVRNAIWGRQDPLHCPQCGMSERELPGFERMHPKLVSYDVVSCKRCGNEWIDRN